MFATSGLISVRQLWQLLTSKFLLSVQILAVSSGTLTHNQTYFHLCESLKWVQTDRLHAALEMEVTSSSLQSGNLKQSEKNVFSYRVESLGDSSSLSTAEDSPCLCLCCCGRRQMDQVRTELAQERAVRQDLECDKTSLERQVLVLNTQTHTHRS